MLTLEQQVGQLLMVGFNGLEAPSYVLDWLANERIGGVILFARNVESPQQLAALTQACHAAAPRPILIGIDQEGGMVARLRANQGFTESPGAMVLGAADSEPLAEAVAAALAADLRALGINWNFAPVVDITYDIRNPTVGVRSLGTDPARITALAQAQVRGFQREGVAASAKHFPSLGDTPVDSHLELPVIEAPPEALAPDLIPYRALVQAGVASVMVTHVNFKALDPVYPSTLSPAIIDGLLRQDVGFDGLVCTDCMEMQAITNHYGPGESAVLAALAGADVILFSHSFTHDEKPHEEAYAALLDAARSGRLPLAKLEAAVERIQRVKQQYRFDGPPAPERVRRPEQVAVMREAARAGVTLLRSGVDVLPLQPDDRRRIGLVEFASYLESGVVESGGETGLAKRLKREFPALRSVALKANPDPAMLEKALALAAEVDVLVLVTRNAHIYESELTAAQAILAQSRQAILLCLRNPFDVDVLPGAAAVICTCGDAEPSIEAAVEALLGRFTPAGRLPVPVAAQTEG